MSLYLSLADNKRIELGEIKEELMRDLEELNMSYIVPFDKLNDKNIKETILQIPEYRIEVSIVNDIITYIKSSSNTFSRIFTLDSRSNIKTENVVSVKNLVLDMFCLDNSQIFIEKINLKAFDIIFIVSKNGRNIRLHLLTDSRNNVYISTMRFVK